MKELLFQPRDLKIVRSVETRRGFKKETSVAFYCGKDHSGGL